VLQNLPTAGSGEVSLANRGNGVPAPLVTEAGVAKFDLTLSLAETAGHLSGGLGGGLEYNADLFSAETAARWAERFVVLLEGIATEPDLAVSELPLLAAAERLAVTRTWVETTGPLSTSTLPDVIAARAREHGDVIALEFGAERVSYAELDRRANALALRLRAHGVGPEVLVALGLERSIELVVAILGTWKAGGAYVPLDPASPRERLAYMLADAAPLLLLTQSALRDRWPDSASATFEVLCLDGADSGEPALSAPLPLPALPETTLDHLAYVIYTSGSTGRPKGVGIPHRGIRHVVASTAQRLGFAPGRRVLQFASPSFDASIWEIAQTLASGATLVLAPREDLHPGPPLEALVRERRIDLITLPPSALPYLSPEALPELATVVLGGEVCPASVIAPWLAAGRTVWNAYGPTEISVCATVAACEQPEAVVPIGRPITNLRVFLFDDGGHPVGIGQPGEILIGGAGLARGYLGRPDLTAERFVPDPFATRPGERLYRTGDLGRFRGDGQIEFLGRTDDQIKIRGFRIELGEIEAVLREEPRLAEVAVLAWPEGEQERRLVAYYTLAKTGSGASPSAADLRRWAKERLPEVMVPVDWIALDAMPKTVSGKLDRRGLPAPPRVRGDELPSYVAPRTVVEAKLAELWGEVLGLERVGIHDEFFTLGGHSLRMTQVLSRIRETLGVEIPLRTFFAEPTIARLAAAVEEGA
jgi:amino acid adenylation domain-containing protein